MDQGGQTRTLPIRTDAQRDLVERVRRLVGNESLIPAQRSYVQQLRVYERLAANAGPSRMHGLRHAYAQQRYRELTGWPSPAVDGPRRKMLSSKQKMADREARQRLSLELGHNRPAIVAVCCG